MQMRPCYHNTSGICELVWTRWTGEYWRGGWSDWNFPRWQKTNVWLLIIGSEIWCRAKQWVREERLIVWEKTKGLISRSDSQLPPSSPLVWDWQQKLQRVRVNTVMWRSAAVRWRQRNFHFTVQQSSDTCGLSMWRCVTYLCPLYRNLSNTGFMRQIMILANIQSILNT